METGGLSVSLQTFPLQSVFNDLMREYGLPSRREGVATADVYDRCAGAYGSPAVGADFGNLIGNAITIRIKGGVAGLSQSLQSIEVRDSGRGIAVEHQDILGFLSGSAGDTGGAARIRVGAADCASLGEYIAFEYWGELCAGARQCVSPFDAGCCGWGCGGAIAHLIPNRIRRIC